MKLTRDVVKNFEHDQEHYGTKVALANVLWLSATDQLTDLGVTNIKTTWKDGSGRKGDRLKRVNRLSSGRKKK